MLRRQPVLRSIILFALLFGIFWLFLYPRARVGECPGQFVLYSALNQDETQLLVVTLPRMPFG